MRQKPQKCVERSHFLRIESANGEYVGNLRFCRKYFAIEWCAVGALLDALWTHLYAGDESRLKVLCNVDDAGQDIGGI